MNRFTSICPFVQNALSPSSESSSSSESLNADEAVLSPDQSDDVKEEPENIQEDLVRQASQEEVDVFMQIEVTWPICFSLTQCYKSRAF